MNMSVKNMCVAFLLCMSAIAQAQTYEQAKAAYDQKDYATALPWFTKLAKAGDARAQVGLGSMYGMAYGVPMDWNSNKINAVFWYLTAAEQGNAEGQYHVGYMYSRGMVPNKNYTDAVDWFLQSAEQGNLDAMGELGRMYAEGRVGVRCDAQEAEKWFLKRAAITNELSDIASIGDIYVAGTCVQRDEQLAVKWYRKGAEKGETLGQYNLGLAYLNGLGDIPKDFKQSAEWLRKSADKGYILAQDQLGVLYANGQGVAKNDLQAVELFRKAAEQGWFKSQFNLGLMYDQGRGVPKDPQMAYYWWSIAKSGNSNAAKELDRIGPTLSETQRATAQERARQFKPSER